MSSPARALALAGLLAVARGQPSDEVVARLLASAPTEHERRLAAELLYGTLRWSLRVDHTLARLLHQPLERLEETLLWGLRLGAYQLLFLSVPDYAAVSETVAAIKRRRPPAARVANAVLRRLAGEGESALPEEPVANTAVQASLPVWLVRRWWRVFGADRARALAEASSLRPQLVLRTNEALLTREELLQRLARAGLEARATPRSPLGVALPRGRVPDLPGFQEGWFQVQGEAAQLAVLAVAAEFGARVADVCAGLGTKSLALAARPLGYRVHAFDWSGERLARMIKEARRLRLPLPERRVMDARQPPQDLWDGFDAVLVDAPCTALGLLARHPEIRLSRTERAIAQFAERELAILKGAARLVARGGLLVYAVCSFEREETEDVVRRFLQERADFAPDETFGDRGCLTLLPDEGLEGFFVARLYRRRSP